MGWKDWDWVRKLRDALEPEVVEEDPEQLFYEQRPQYRDVIHTGRPSTAHPTGHLENNNRLEYTLPPLQRLEVGKNKEEVAGLVRRPKAGPYCEACHRQVSIKYTDPIQIAEVNPENQQETQRIERGLCGDCYLERYAIRFPKATLPDIPPVLETGPPESPEPEQPAEAEEAA